MGTGNPVTITVETIVHSSVESVWKYWTDPKHIMQWNKASDDWHTPYAENDLKVGGKFVSRMEAKDGSFGFDFGGVYDEVSINESISYTFMLNCSYPTTTGYLLSSDWIFVHV